MKVKKDFEGEKFSTFKYKRTNKRVLIKQNKDLGANSSNTINGRVFSVISRTIYVKTDVGNLFEATIKGVIHSENELSSLIAVGDYVSLKIKDGQIGESGFPLASISKIEKRKNFFSREASGYEPFEHIIASNIDYVLILLAATNPNFSLKLLDRFLISAELNGVKPIICINKTDLLKKKEIKFIEEDLQLYYDFEIPIFFVSFIKQKGINELLTFINGSEIVLVGPSGVGKSTFINELFEDEIQKTNEISNFSNKGTHTTSFSRMFEYNDAKENINFKIIDTPGIKEFGIWGLDKNDLTFYFHDFDNFANQCKFNPCTHTHEPGCKIIEAVENEEIDVLRYESYLNILESLK